MKISQLQGAFFWNITVSVFLRVVDVVLNLSFFLRRCFGKAQSSRYLLVAPLKQVARPAGTNIHDARWPNRDDLCEARIQIHTPPQKMDPPSPGWNYMWDGQEKGVGFLWGTKRLGWKTWVEFSWKIREEYVFSNQITPIQKKKRVAPSTRQLCVFLIPPKARMKFTYFAFFPEINEKTSKLKDTTYVHC